MRKFKTRRPSALPFRSLFVAVAGALLLTGFIVPKADAQIVVSYFNFEDGPPLDLTPDKTVAAGGDNPGGGVEVSTSNLTIAGNSTDVFAPGLLNNRTALDSDTNNPGGAIGFRRTGGNPGMTMSFSVNTQLFTGYSLSFAVSNAGNGYHNVTLSWSGAVTGSLPQQTILTTTTLVTFNLNGTNVDGNGVTPKFVTFTLTFTNGQSNGNNQNETIIDNIQLTATALAVPEPATVAGGLLGVLGLCWFQRRRLIRYVRFRRT